MEKKKKLNRRQLPIGWPKSGGEEWIRSWNDEGIHIYRLHHSISAGLFPIQFKYLQLFYGDIIRWVSRSRMHPQTRNATDNQIFFSDGMWGIRITHQSGRFSHPHPHFHDGSELREPYPRKTTAATFIEFNKNKQTWCGVARKWPMRAALHPKMDRVKDGCSRHWRRGGVE